MLADSTFLEMMGLLAPISQEEFGECWSSPGKSGLG